MGQVDRFSVSLDLELLAAFDQHIASRGYHNRSEAVRDLIRDLLTSSRAQGSDAPIVAILTAVCRHQEADAGRRLRDCLAENAELVGGSLHFPLDAQRDVLAIALSGRSDRVQALADRIQAMRGISHGRLTSVMQDT